MVKSQKSLSSLQEYVNTLTNKLFQMQQSEQGLSFIFFLSKLQLVYL